MEDTILIAFFLQYIPSSYSMVFFPTFCPFSNEDDDNNDDDGARDGGDDDGRLEQADHRRGGLRARGAQILGGGEALPSTAARPTREAEKHLEQRILLRGRSPDCRGGIPFMTST